MSDSNSRPHKLPSKKLSINLAPAQEATSRARVLLEEIVREGEALDARERRDAEGRANSVREAVASGNAVSFDENAGKTAGARSELDARRAAAERVVADLRGEEHHLESVARSASDAVTNAVRAVLAEEARAIASRWLAVEAEAKALRLRLGRYPGAVPMEGSGEGVWKALSLNDEIRLDPLGLELDRAVTIAWRGFSSALTASADAQLNFAEVDLCLNEMRAPRNELLAKRGREITERMIAGATR